MVPTRPKLARLILGAYVIVQLLGCDNQEFVGTSWTEDRSPGEEDNSDQTTEQRRRTEHQGADIIVESDLSSGTIDAISGNDDLSDVPGVGVQKLGIHFEDGSDGDFNDLSACFDGKFKVNDRAIVSITDQIVNVTFKRISAADHTFLFRVLDHLGNEVQVVSKPLQRNEQVSYQIKFPLRSTLYVQTTIQGRTVYDLDHPSMAMVEKDICRSTGR